jgi:hypothetical protein
MGVMRISKDKKFIKNEVESDSVKDQLVPKKEKN